MIVRNRLSFPAAWPLAALTVLGQPLSALAQVSPELPAERVIVTGNPLGRTDMAQPNSVLSGERLLLRKAGTLGETLDGLPGVAATWFGPNSNRPTIRGLDGDRVRLLDNAGATVDASNLSFDHAVAIDPLVIERVEVLRGPASLLYGGNATGGVINTLDNRVPRDPLDGVSGRAEMRLGGAADERSLSALLEGGQGGLNWHVDAFGRHTSDLSVPRFRPVEDGEAGSATDRVRNSAAEARGGAVGVSWADAHGHVGASVDSYHNDYGVTVEPDVSIRMKRERLNLSAQRRLDGFWRQVDLQLSDTRYRHEEVEGTGEIGTTFSSKGQSLRAEAHHAALAGWRGVLGVQAESLSFSALGEEAFVPSTRTRSMALFALEQTDLGPVNLSGGLRLERVRVSSDGDAASAEEPRFGDAASRSFTPMSASLSARWALPNGWALTGVLGATERAPAYYELYANGLHLATAAYERGDATLGTERSRHADLGLQWKAGADSLSANLFTMDFSRFISLEATGEQVSEVGEDGETSLYPVYQFLGVPARLWGLELETKKRLISGAWQWDATASLDLTRGENRLTGEALPRLAPRRIGLTLEASHGAWRMGLGLKHASAQRQVPSTDIATAGYTLLNAWLSRGWQWGAVQGTLFAKLDNLTDELAYSASSIRTVRELSPLPGRALSAGVQVRF